MTKKIALMLVIVMAACFVWSLLGPAFPASLAFGAHGIHGPAGVFVGIFKTVIALVVLACVGFVLTFVFVGVGIVVIGAVLFALAMICLPFLLPLLIPLFLIWLFCVVIRKMKTA